MSGRDALPAAVHLITGEFPPQVGGVSDYTLRVARGLATAGVLVHVWCPGESEDADSSIPGVLVHRAAGCWRGKDIARLDRLLSDIAPPHRFIVQWVPHAYGRRSLNVGFCAWLRRRSRLGDTVDLMVHEPFLAFGEGGWRQDAAAAIHRVMVSLLLRHVNRVWVSIPAWAESLRPYCFGRHVSFEWQPVPNNVPVVDDRRATLAARRSIAPDDCLVVGHFGTYESKVSHSLAKLVPALLAANPRVAVLLCGRNSDTFRHGFASTHAEIAHRIHASGRLDAHELSVALQACDILVQPYPDGASTRRTTLMAALAHGIPTITTVGRLSEALWQSSGAVRLVSAEDDDELLAAVLELCLDEHARRRFSRAGRAIYAERFDLDKTIQSFIIERPPRVGSHT